MFLCFIYTILHITVLPGVKIIRNYVKNVRKYNLNELFTSCMHGPGMRSTLYGHICLYVLKRTLTIGALLYNQLWVVL